MLSSTAAYHTLLGLVYDKFPEDAVALSIKAGVSANTVTLQNVRRGTTHKLPLLIEMVQACIPDFPIPAAVLAAA